MSTFNLADVLAGAGVNIDTGKREQIEYISIDRIAPDPDNFYELSGIEDLAENISLLGLQQPIRVRPMTGDDSQVIIISGHRRYTALKMLIEQDGREDLRDVPCIVEQGEENPKLTQLKLIYANASTRIMSSAEQAKQAELVEKLLYELKEDGMEFPGRMRDHVAQACQISTGKLARLKVIREGLGSFWQTLWESGKIKESVAYALARIPKDKQHLIYEKFGKSDKNITDLTSDAIGQYNSRFERIDKITCKKRNSGCTNRDNMQKKALEVSRWYSCECKQCCSNCSELANCKRACVMLRDKQQKLRREKQEKQNQKELEAEERDRPKVEYISKVYSRLGAALDLRSLTVSQFGEQFILPYDHKKIERMVNGTEKINASDRLPFGYGFFLSDAKVICDAADLLGCSIDYLLGRTDCMPVVTCTESATENVSNIDTWHTGNPPKPGEYVVLYVDAIDLGPVRDVMTDTWLGDRWSYIDTVPEMTVVAWTCLPPDLREDAQ